MRSDQDLFDELSYYTLAHPDPAFIHQNAVDAYAAQHADHTSKPIQVVFALIGLYLSVEKNWSGKQVQRAHMQLARRRRRWVAPPFPSERGVLRVENVLAAALGERRDAMIRNWCVSVWDAWKGNCGSIRDLVRDELDVD
jgi:hypothetical protein